MSSASFPGALDATLPSTVFSKLRHAHQSLGDLVQNAVSNPGGLERGPSVRVSNKLPGELGCPPSALRMARTR